MKSNSKDTTLTTSLNVKYAINYFIAQGFPSEKLILGIPFYGRTYNLSNTTSHEIGSPSNGSGPLGPFTNTYGFLGYNELCNLTKSNFSRIWDPESQVPYMFQGNVWISFDDDKSVILKTKYIESYNLGGVMVWSIDMDDFRGDCDEVENFSLLKTVEKSLRKGIVSRFSLVKS